MKQKAYIGIDNGYKGALCILTKNDIIFYDTPIIETLKKSKTSKGNPKTKKNYDILEIVKIIEKAHKKYTCIALLEKAQPFPKQGGISNFSIGEGYGIWQAVLTFAKIPYFIESPKNWQKQYNISATTDKKSLKNELYLIASRLFPAAELKTQTGKILDGRVDALLMAEVCRRKFTKTPSKKYLKKA